MSFLRTLSKRLLREAGNDDVEKEPGEDSLDDQIDKFLVEYETEAKSAKNEGLDYRMLVRRILTEEDEDEDKEEKSDEDKPAEPEKGTADDLDVESYVASVMRLVGNYDSLLEVRNTILRRAKNFLGKNYDKTAVEAFDSYLQDGYGMEIGKSKYEKEDEIQAPKAGAAGPAGGGGG